MSVFRIEKTKDFTIMSNHHLRNRNLTLKAKGLMSLMLSLPEEWDYTLKGLSLISKEGVDAIRVAVLELEQQGYVVRERIRNETTIFNCFNDSTNNGITPRTSTLN